MSEQFQIGSYHLTVKNRLAEGGFGFVDLVYENNSRQDLVLKRCDVQRSESMDTVKKEISVLENFAGPYIVKYMGAEIITTKVGNHRQALVLLEFCPGGHLLDRLLARNGSFLPMEVIYRIFGQLLMGVGSLHAHNPPTVHRDLKLENVLFGADGNVRLCDFGSCETSGCVPLKCSVDRANAEEVLAKETTQMYRAPEMCDLFLRDELTEKTDIWALGCIYFALCYLIHPFQDCGPLGILNGKMAAIPVGGDDHVPDTSTVLIGRMLDVDPEARPTCAQLVSAFAALSQGAPLPPYELSTMALQKRSEREEAAVKRASKQTKKAYKHGGPLPPKPTATAGDVSGAAARRLAAKKGVSYQAPAASNQSQSFGAAPVAAFDTDFSTPVAAAGGGNEFDPFGGGTAPATQAQQQQGFDTGFDDFGGGTAPATRAQQQQGFDTGFDDFGGGTAPATQAQQQQGFDTGFDDFGGGTDIGSGGNLADADSLFDAPPAASNFDDMFGSNQSGDGGGGGVLKPPTPPPAGSTDSLFDAPPVGVNFDDMFGSNQSGGGGVLKPPTPPPAGSTDSLFDAPPVGVNFDDMFGSNQSGDGGDGGGGGGGVLKPPTPPPAGSKPLSSIFQPVDDGAEYSTDGARRSSFGPFGGGEFQPPAATATAAPAAVPGFAPTSNSFSEFDQTAASAPTDNGNAFGEFDTGSASSTGADDFDLFPSSGDAGTSNPFSTVSVASKSVQVDLFNKCMEESAGGSVGPTAPTGQQHMRRPSQQEEVLSMFDRPASSSSPGPMPAGAPGGLSGGSKFDALDQLAGSNLRPGMMPPQGGRPMPNRGSINMGQAGGGWSGTGAGANNNQMSFQQGGGQHSRNNSFGMNNNGNVNQYGAQQGYGQQQPSGNTGNNNRGGMSGNKSDPFATLF